MMDCDCQPGYKGRQCEHKYDVCEPSPCYPGTNCTITVHGKFNCSRCPQGREGNGIKCYGNISKHVTMHRYNICDKVMESNAKI